MKSWKMKRKGRRNRQGMEYGVSSSNLTFNVNLSEGKRFSAFKETQSFASQKTDPIISFFQKDLAIMMAYESSALVVGFEAKLLGKEAQSYIGFIAVHGVSVAKFKDVIAPYDLQMLDRAARRSRLTNISVRYAPMFGVSRYSWKNL